MAATNRVVWSDGLFIKPQHFQQQQRYLEHQINERALAVSDYLYGFSDLELNAEYLSFGRVGLVRASGLFPDGTRFNLPQDDVMPEPLEITDASVPIRWCIWRCPWAAIPWRKWSGRMPR